jgi:YD repeat-containing protein
MKNSIALMALVCLFPIGLGGQTLSKKEASKEGLKSVAVWQTNLSDGKTKPLLESLSRYDTDGNLIEITERDNSGMVTLHETYEYNEDGLKTVETHYGKDSKIQKKHVYKYSNGLRTERLTYDKTGTLISQYKYVYEFHNK